MSPQRLLRPVVLLSLTLALAPFPGCGPSTTTPVDLPLAESDLPEESTFLAQVDRTKGYRDCFVALREPEFVGVDANARHRLTPDEMVIGLDLGGSAFAYPVNLLNQHEIVEHTAAGLDLLVCW